MIHQAIAVERTVGFKDISAKRWLIKSAVFLVCLIIPGAASAQLELYGKFKAGGSIEPVIDYYGSKNINDKFAITFFGLVRQTWGQALIGASYLVTPNVTLFASAGIEQGQRRLRYSASVVVKSRANSFLALGELGAGYQNYLYKINVFHQFSKSISLGIMDWRYHGVGPDFRYSMAKLKTTAWVMPAWDHEQGVLRCMMGLALDL